MPFGGDEARGTWCHGPARDRSGYVSTVKNESRGYNWRRRQLRCWIFASIHSRRRARRMPEIRQLDRSAFNDATRRNRGVPRRGTPHSVSKSVACAKDGFNLTEILREADFL